MEESLLTFPEVCRRFSVSEATLRNWVKRGLLSPEADPEGNLRAGESRAEEMKAGQHSGEAHLKRACFRETQVKMLEEQLESGAENRLAARRNKGFAGNPGAEERLAQAGAYLPSVSVNRRPLEQILCWVQDQDISEEALPDLQRGILEDCAAQLAEQAGCRLPETCRQKQRRKTSKIPQVSWAWCPEEDTLGALYQALRSLRVRKRSGSYYTPAALAVQAMEKLQEASGAGAAPAHRAGRGLPADPPMPPSGCILDPSCGSGQFLMQAAASAGPLRVRGFDVDPEAVRLARLNLYLRYPQEPFSVWEKRIRCADFLCCPRRSLTEAPAAVIGNPPWGVSYTAEEQKKIRRKYGIPGQARPESAAAFVLESLHRLPRGGRLSMVLPESLLYVGHCRRVREEILRRCRVDSVVYLGEYFAGVQCPAILLTLTVTGEPMKTAGTKVSGKSSYEIRTERHFSADRLPFHLTDAGYELAEKLRDPSAAPKTTLAGQAAFALGIVTGDNKRLLLEHPREGTEPVLRGKDIRAYHADTPCRWLYFSPRQFQQCPPEEMFRAPEKLIYRFVSSRLTFARDTSGILTLNSANILVPRISGVPVPVIEAVLNSRPAEFLFTQEIRSVKVLRSHLENLPIPLFSRRETEELTELVLRLEKERDPRDAGRLRRQIEQIVTDAYGLTDAERALLEKQVPEP